MKKVYILSILMLFAVSVFAQKTGYVLKKMPAQELNTVKTPTDTLLPGNLNFATPTGYVLYGSANGGYIIGTNGYGDAAKGQEFEVLTPYAIEGAIYWFGAKTIVAGTGTMKFVVWSMDGTTGTTTLGTGDQPCPSTVLGEYTESVSNVDTSSMMGNAYIAAFTPFISVISDYVIGFDVSTAYPDSIGLVSTTDGDGGLLELVWEKWSPDGWYTLQGAGWSSGDFDVDAMILPIVDMNAGGIDGADFINGVKMTSTPNPASSNVTLSYELQNNADRVLVRILDGSGKVINKMELGSQNAGSYDINLDVTDYPAGTYFYLLNADANCLAKRMLIVK